jgi:hypothetical protein
MSLVFLVAAPVDSPQKKKVGGILQYSNDTSFAYRKPCCPAEISYHDLRTISLIFLICREQSSLHYTALHRTTHHTVTAA